MRPIDGDALIVAIEQMMKHQIDADDICEMIQNFPTINPERKKGKWIPCNEKLPRDDDEMEDDELVLVTYKTTNKIHPCQYHDDGAEILGTHT